MGSSSSISNQLGDKMMTNTKQFVEQYESKLKDLSSQDINLNLRNSITKDLYVMNEIIKGKLGVVKIGIIGRCFDSKDKLIESLILSEKNHSYNNPKIYCSETVLNSKNSSGFVFNQNFFGQSFDIDQKINKSLEEIFNNTVVSNKDLRISKYPDIPMIIKDHLMLINLPVFQRINRFPNKASNSRTDNIELDLNDIQNMLLYFSYCDIIIYLVNEYDRDIEIDYLTKLIENSLILQTLKQENKLYFLIDQSSNHIQSTKKGIQEKLEKVISNINHKFYYEVNLKNGIQDKTLFFFQHYKKNLFKITSNEMNRFRKEYKEIAEKRYTALGNQIKNKNDPEFKKFKAKLKIEYEDPKCISKDYSEFEEVLVGEIMNQVSKNINLLKSELAYKILIAISKQSGNHTLFLDRARFLREEIINNIETIFTELIRNYEDKKIKLVDENLKVQEIIKEVEIETFTECSLLWELFDLTGNSHKYSYLIENTRIKFNNYMMSLFNKFAELSNEMIIKLSFLERTILNSYNRVLLSFEKEFVLNSTPDTNIFLEQIGNMSVEKVLSYKLRSTVFFTNVFMSNFNLKKPRIRSIFPYYLIPNIIGMVVAGICFLKGFSGKNSKKLHLATKFSIGGMMAMLSGLYLSSLLNKIYKRQSERVFKENIEEIEENVNNLTTNFMKFGEKVSSFEKYYKSKATEFIDLF
jgi:hypothetical protein